MPRVQIAELCEAVDMTPIIGGGSIDQLARFAEAVRRFVVGITALQNEQEARLAALEDEVGARRRRMTDKDFDIDVTEERRGG